MLVSDCIAFQRIILATVSGANVRWSDTQLTVLTDRAVKGLVAEILFPESRLSQPAVANTQLYQLPALHIIKRVYIAGQPIVEVPGGIGGLEGLPTQLYDQSGTGTPVAGSDAPPGAGGVAQPQWVVQTPLAYPFLNAWGCAPAPMAQPWSTGSRSRWYLRGGWIGFVPAPANTAEITVDCVRIPGTLTSTGDLVTLPDNFMDAITWKVATYAAFANNDDRSSDQRNYASQMYSAEMRTLRTWKRQFGLDDVGPMQFTERNEYAYGGHRAGGGGAAYD